MTRRTEIRKSYSGDREVEWEFDLCLNCKQEISRSRYISPLGVYERKFSKWYHKNGQDECVFYAQPLSEAPTALPDNYDMEK